MNYKQAYNICIKPGLELLPERMRTPEAIAMLLTIGMQESKFKYREQVQGPAMGFFQFEHGGGVKGVLKHHSVHNVIEGVLKRLQMPRVGMVGTSEYVYEAIAYNDALACIMARLFLWTDSHPLPALNSGTDESWNYYIRIWRPGKPHRATWNAYRSHSVEFVNELYGLKS